MLVLQPIFFVIIFVNHIKKGAEIMVLDVLGYVLGIGFIVFGISALILWGNEIYKIISKSDKTLVTKIVFILVY